MPRRILLLCVVGLSWAAALHADEIGFAEDFALAKDRAEALKKLIPGTEDYFYYHCLHYLNTRQFDKAVALFKPWLERFQQSPRLTEMQTRHALLNYDNDPQQSLQFFKTKLGLTFDHQRMVVGNAPDLPTALDPKTISREALAAYSRSRWQQGAVDNYEDLALDWLLTDQVDAKLRRHLLARLSRPDISNLPKIIADDLSAPNSGGFGSLKIHQQLTLAQLNELLKLKPELLNQTGFALAWIFRLQPGDDEDWRHNSAQLKAYLDRLLVFTRQLAPAFNALKAHVLFHRLALDKAQGAPQKALLLEYLQLPRFQVYMSKAMLENERLRQQPADLNANFIAWTLLPSVGNDESLVRSYLKHFLADAESAKEFEPFINDVYLKHLFAETKIELGLGEPEQWAAQLPPELFRQLKERVDIDFAPTNKTDFAVDDPVKLDLFIKNVPTLVVKVFEINTQNFYRTQKREVDTSINLDGLVANAEKTHAYTDTPFRRVGRTFEFPQMNKPGVYVIDFIGAGKSSRALIRKGRLRALAGMSTAGQKLTVIDDAGKLVPGAKVWLGGQEYKANDQGVAFVPFSTAPSRQPVVLGSGDFSSLDFLEHQAENYSLIAGIHVDREALLTQRLASVLVRPSLRLNGLPVSIKPLEDVKLVIVATDQDGIATSAEVPDFKLFEDRETVYEFRTPSRLTALHVTLRAKVKSLSLGKDVDLMTSERFVLNGITHTDAIEDMHLARFGDDYIIEVLGRTGEFRPDRPVQLTLKHREFREPAQALLKSDAKGRIALGALTDIVSISATGPEGVSHTWSLPLNRHTYRGVIHAKAGESIALPYPGSATKPSRNELALFEMRGDILQADRFDALAIGDGMIEMTGLKPGDYELLLKDTGERIRVRVVNGDVQAGYVLGKLRHVELPALKPLQIANISTEADVAVIQLRDMSPFTRVHVFGTRYLPEFSAFANLSKVHDVESGAAFPLWAESIYLAGRNIGDEYRYVLDRRLQKKFPGNMLERPSLLLNPWVLRSTETGEQLARGGEGFAGLLRSGGGNAEKPKPGMPGLVIEESARLLETDYSANLDFLFDSSAVLVNLVPDKNGVVRVPRKLLGPHSFIHVVAVDPVNTTARSFGLPEQKADFVDLRLRNGLNPYAHFTQQKQVNVLTPGKALTLADAAGSRYEVYDSLAKVYGLYATLSRDAKLAEFSFILNWPKLKLAEKQSLYSQYACHELNFFLAKKDPEFFRALVKPYLANKKDKTFVDHWLLEDDLKEYLQPWQFARLNTAERVLLAQRVTGESAKTARHLNDLLRLQPPDLSRDLWLYETAVKAGELGRDEKLFKKVPRLEEAMKEMPTSEARTLLDLKVMGNTVTKESLLKRSAPKADPSTGPTIGYQWDPSNGRLPEKRDGDIHMRTKREAAQALDLTNPDHGLDSDLLASTEAEKELAFLGDDRSSKHAPARLYRRLDATLELAENNYYKLPIREQLASLIGVSSFWLDYARHDGQGPFLSKNLADASHNFSEMMFALAVLDLPFTPGKHHIVYSGGAMTFTPASLSLIFHEEVKPVADARVGAKLPILVNQNFYRSGDRFRDDNGERLDKFVTEEFVVHTVYGCQVVVTNTTPSRQRLSLLLQTPVGSIPVANGQATKTVWLDLEPFTTQVVDYQFYFPAPGSFAHFPVHVAKGEALVAAAQPFTFNVVAKPSKLDADSWDFVSQNGSNEQVLAMLERENINALDLTKIAFRMRDKAFFFGVVAELKERHVFEPTLWSYGLFHNAPAMVQQYLAHNDRIVNECGGPIASALLTIDPVARHQYEHLAYKPLINGRAHGLGHTRQIVNGAFSQQYQRYLKLLGYQPKLDDNDLLEAAYYLLLQDRVEDAMTAFAQVDRAQVATQMQFDYCAAYLDMFNDDPRQVRSVIAPYLNHPVERWRNAFAAIANQLDEWDGKAAKVADKDDQAQQQAKLAAKEPSFEFAAAAKTINLTWKNVESVRINYYLMDVELLFSRNPFVQQSGGQFAQIRPNETQEYKLPNFQSKLAIPMPDSLADKNVLVEITAKGKTRSHAVLANAMSVAMNENYGQLQVTEAATGKPLAKVYVKTYVQLENGAVKFHKDGYTDHRGKFDYASVSTPQGAGIAKFGILVLSETQGAVIREAAPPKQ
jgi:hypothetical protein